MRLNKYISHYAKYSRREADSLIASGRVNVEKQKAVLGQELQEGQRVFIDGKMIKPKKEAPATVIVYHKPKGELVTKKDDRDRKSIFESLGKKYAHFTPVGRLDFASEGLLLLSDDKNIVRILMESDLEREYILKIAGRITEKMIMAMEEGISLEDARAGGHEKSKIIAMDFKPFVSYFIYKNDRNFSKLKVKITEGHNRELRRFFAHFKAEVLDLRRVSYGFVELNALPVGKVRYLNRDEYKKLHSFIKEKQGDGKKKESGILHKKIFKKHNKSFHKSL
ncbi:pseudouridine synthase [Helicobacter sp. faydin-H20]|uniref:pseudouridine synthase n=1 Tax=Helicobacter anatolicus TaxID=2905874 RepID=UPI001E2ED477|nr:pseudouridine synthase [Helicobacter anatolicus]MCE3037048.1 pseudouridine synthase [Helicobacter anatolicus]